MKNRRALVAALAAVAATILVILLYLPGLKGSWLVDDTPNIGVFLSFTPDNAPYHGIIFSNNSGPLGRPVSMASFALNHVAGLFSPYALKASNLCIHLANALLLFLLLHRIFLSRAPTTKFSPLTLAAALSLCWAILPIHISSVLYIVQRMTLLAAFFSLLSLLAYVAGRQAMGAGALRRGLLLLAACFVVFLPLAFFAKESAFSTLPWLLLLELFLFQPAAQKHMGKIVTGLVLAAVAAAILLVLVLGLDKAYLWRDFSLTERLLSEARAVCSYARNIFLPDNSVMGVFHDDYPVSQGLFSPWTTAPALMAIAALVLASIMTAGRYAWMVSLGILLFLSGHLIESSIIPLELYFEHRNYLPAIGLLLAVSQLLLASPLSRKSIMLILALYFSVLAFSTYQRTQIWGDNNTLLEISALHHPQSVRAWTDHVENLVSQGKGGEALQADGFAAQANPEMAGIFHMQMVSIYCRSNQTPPPPLVQLMAESLGQLPADRPSAFISISTGLDFILTQYKQQQCGTPDFAPLVPGLLQLDSRLSARFGKERSGLWGLRMFIGEWLLALSRPDAAVHILQDAWDHGERSEIPMLGLTLAKALQQTGDTARLLQVLDQLERVADNPPPDFQAEMASLRSGHQE